LVVVVQPNLQALLILLELLEVTHRSQPLNLLAAVVVVLHQLLVLVEMVDLVGVVDMVPKLVEQLRVALELLVKEIMVALVLIIQSMAVEEAEGQVQLVEHIEPQVLLQVVMVLRQQFLGHQQPMQVEVVVVHIPIHLH
jgi:hypothetical protein